MKLAVIIPAAGQGKRFSQSDEGAGGGSSDSGSGDAFAQSLGAAKSKIEVDLAGQPIFFRAVELFAHRSDVAQVILAVDPDDVSAFKFRWGDKLSFIGVDVVAGGRKERWETVQQAIAHVRDECTHIAVHDAARPVTSVAMIDRVFGALSSCDAVIPGAPVNATLKRTAEVDQPGSASDPLDDILGDAGRPSTTWRKVTAGVDRRDLVEVQTPQAFEASLLRKAYAQVAAGSIDASTITDDAGLIEAMGQSVFVVEGEPTNLKITRRSDLELAAAIITMREGGKARDLGAKRLFADLDDD